ncbi:substrate-binding periplasmic protein [Marinobacter sp.]|uniref:substrate-binding periplasmic protein n=1 Tax=Marinobacter sp. TaxID=50741 RepID=UPI003A8C8BA8
MSRTLALCLVFILVACSQPEDSLTVAPEVAAKATEISQATPATEPRRKIVIGADPWCPHNCEAGSDREGYMVDIAREAFGMAGIDVEYVNMSWARAIQQARDGYIDGIVGALPGDAPDFVFPEEATGHTTTVLYTHPDNVWNFNGIESLSNLTLLAINGYSYSPELDAYIAKHQNDPEKVWILSGPAPLSRAIELLDKHRSDVFPEDRDVMEWALKQQGNRIALRITDVIHQSAIYIAFSPERQGSEELSDLLSQGTRALKSSGRIEQIMARYGLTWLD